MPTPIDAASVILVRDTPEGFEVYMLQRHHGHDFMANHWVFPGGKVDDVDRIEHSGESTGDFTAADAVERLDNGVDAPTAMGLHLAAIRETFEEAAVLLARHRDGRDLRFGSGARTEALADVNRLQNRVEGGVALTELAADEDLVLAAGELVFFSHWITPEFESHRYDTRFFLARLPGAQRPRHDDGESTDGRWFTPAAAIDSYRGGDIELAPPTLRILERLSNFESIPQAIQQLRRLDPPAILPQLSPDADAPTLLLPGDPDYPEDLDVESPGGVTRMERRDGQWFSVFPRCADTT